MKRLFFTLVAVWIALPAFAKESSPGGTTHQQYAHNHLKKSFEFSVSGEDLKNTPSWRETEPFPPLSPRKAKKAADRLMAKIFKDEGIKDCCYEFDEIALQSVGGKKWIYSVRYHCKPKNASGERIALDTISVLVLMNGKAVVPTIKPLPTNHGSFPPYDEL